jgi:hypothetical protein
MSTLLNFLKSLRLAFQSAPQVDEDYLAHSVDICDLERRMRELEDRDRSRERDFVLGLYASR